MAPAKKTSAKKTRAPAVAAGVDAFMQTLAHPLKAEVQALRVAILGADPRIVESIKWNAPSFACPEHFATFNLRAKDAVQIVFHRGAKVKAENQIRTAVADPDGLLQWLAHDRATIKFQTMRAIKANATALEAIVQQWIAHAG